MPIPPIPPGSSPISTTTISTRSSATSPRPPGSPRCPSRDRQRGARFDAVAQPLPTPPVPSFRRRAGRIPTLDVVARPGHPVVVAHARSSGLPTGTRLDGHLSSLPGSERLSTLALHASSLSAVRTLHRSVSDHGGLACPIPALDPYHNS